LIEPACDGLATRIEASVGHEAVVIAKANHGGNAHQSHYQK
jgi:hypothetical protein